MLDIVKKTLFRIAVDTVLPSFSSKRWTVLRTDQGLFVFGYCFGRRTVNTLGVVALLVLEADGSFKPMLVPVSGPPPEIDEESARAGFVLANKRGYIPRGHAFEPSAVYPALCGVCAEGTLYHERDQKIVKVQAILSTLDVSVTFQDGTSEILDIKVKNAPIQQPTLNPMPGEEPKPQPKVEDEKPPKALYRSLTAEEHATVTKLVAEALPSVGAPSVGTSVSGASAGFTP